MPIYATDRFAAAGFGDDPYLFFFSPLNDILHTSDQLVDPKKYADDRKRLRHCEAKGEFIHVEDMPTAIQTVMREDGFEYALLVHDGEWDKPHSMPMYADKSFDGELYCLPDETLVWCVNQEVHWIDDDAVEYDTVKIEI